MNYTYEELLTRLKNGEDATAIGNEFATMLNKAKEEAEAKSAKKEAFAALVEQTIAFFRTYYPEVAEDFSTEASDIDLLLEEIEGLVKMLADLKKLAVVLPKGKEEKESDPLEEFLNAFVR